jgi:hypothetical protein
MAEEQPIPEDTNPDATLAPSPEVKREEAAAEHAATMEQMLPPADSDPAAKHAQVLSEMAGAVDVPKATAAEEVAAIPTEDLGDEPERTAPAERDAAAEHAAVLNDLAQEKEYESFGDKLDAFNAAGGADNSVPNIGDDSSGDESHDAGQELMDADMGNRNRMSEMLIEHARLIDENTRYLESERL